MAGGAGTRLWPMSREEKPKQFLNLSGKGSLLEETILRLKPLNPQNIVIATAKKYEDLSSGELDKVGIKGTILAEPRARNTAAAIFYAAAYIKQRYEDAVMIVLPADHYIAKPDVFQEVLELGVHEAEKNSLVTIGIKPSYPETGYGYIKALESSGEIRSVDRFVEKPDAETARSYVSSGDYFWNSGIFIWKTSVIMRAFTKNMPGLVKAFQPLVSKSSEDIAMNSGQVWALKESIFNSIESVSVDYGIMEKADSVKVIPGDFGWADLGSWKSIDDILGGDDENNRAAQSEKAIFVDSHNCSVFSEDARISVVGLSNLVVVQAGNEILVIDKDASQNVRRVVDMIREK